MCRGKENESNQKKNITDVISENEELDCLDKMCECQESEPSITETQPIDDMKNCSDEQSCNVTKEKLLENVVASEDNENVKKIEEYAIIKDDEKLVTADIFESNFQQDNEKIVLPKIILPEPSWAFSNDISVFCFSQQGESHIKNNIPCQDRSGFKIIDDNIIITAIADGVGSCSLSDYGAEVAINSSLSFLEQYFISECKQDSFEFDNPTKMGKVLREMMRFAFENVEKRAVELQQLSYSFQSTLTVAAYDGNTLYFAHAGDDGIVALNKMGTYALVTSRHKGDEASSVYPLQSQNTWQFGKVNDTVAFVMATDGVLDAFVRPLTENNRVYFPFIEPVFSNSQANDDDVKQTCYDWYEYMASPSYRASVTDDLSFIGVVNQGAIKTSVKPKFEINKWEQQTKEYQERRKAALYPSKSENNSNSVVITQRSKNVMKNESDTVKGTVNVHEKSNNNGRPTGTQYYNKSEQEKNINKPQYDRISVDSSDSTKQIREAAKKVNSGMKEFAAASAVVILKGVGRATSYLGETIEQVSEEMEKKSDPEKWSDSNNSNGRS